MRLRSEYQGAFGTRSGSESAFEGGKRVVAIHILEDDPGVADSLKLLLQQYGHRVMVHPDAESFFEHEPPSQQDVVIVDLGLPGISGAHVIRWLRNLRDAPRVIAITGQGQASIDEALGSMDRPILLRKPLTEDKLAVFF